MKNLSKRAEKILNDLSSNRVKFPNTKLNIRIEEPEQETLKEQLKDALHDLEILEIKSLKGLSGLDIYRYEAYQRKLRGKAKKMGISMWRLKLRIEERVDELKKKLNE
jgi:hypothetical protein